MQTQNQYQLFINDTVDKPVSLPDQVFVPQDIDFLLTIGGDLAEDEEEFNALMSLFQELGEKEFYIREHSTQLGKLIPFEMRFSVATTYRKFEKQAQEYSDFGLQVASWFVFGTTQNWGIYMAEMPSINIIGCKRQLSEKFRQVFKISNSGYTDLKTFVKDEFRNQKLIEEFEANYRLNGA